MKGKKKAEPQSPCSKVKKNKKHIDIFSTSTSQKPNPQTTQRRLRKRNNEKNEKVVEQPSKNLCKRVRNNTPDCQMSLRSSAKKARMSELYVPSWSELSYEPPSETEVSWTRGMEKYSPSKCATYSPIKPLEANLKPEWARVFNCRKPDFGLELISGFSWTVNMSEQFFYDNSLTLLSKYRANYNHMQNVLRTNSAGIYKLRKRMYEDYVQVKLLGEGGYGKVFKAMDRTTGEFVAIKLVNPCKATKYKEFFKQTLEYMTERNYMMKATNSPFMVHFYFSFFEEKINTEVLVFECCIGDLFSVLPMWDMKLVLKIGEGVKDGLQDSFQKKSKTMRVTDLKRVVLIYILELFCGLDFLVQCNIIHNDIKPENVMISVYGHLKIADFGLVRNSHFLTAKQQVEMVTASELDNLTSSRFDTPPVQGTRYYFDMELLNFEIGEKVSSILNKEEHVSNFSQYPYFGCFLSDAWATSMLALQVMLLGDEILSRENWPSDLIKKMKIPNNKAEGFFILVMTIWKRLFSNLLEKSLIEFVGPELQELTTFLVSLLRPRAVRGEGFTVEKEVLLFDKRQKMAYLNLEKIASIDIFRKSGITPANVFLLPVPSLAYINPNKPDKKSYIYKTYDQLIGSLFSKTNKDKHMFSVEPGYSLSML